MDVFEAVASRYSCRAFLPTPVPEATVRDIIERAVRAPSAGNMQPWRIYAIAGKRIETLKALMAPRMDELPAGEGAEYQIYPDPMGEPYRARRFEVGDLLYQSISVPRADRPAILAQLPVLRRAGRAVLRARAPLRPRTMGGYRRAAADGHHSRPRPWSAHMSTAGLGLLPWHGALLPQYPPGADCLFGHVARVCGRKRAY